MAYGLKPHLFIEHGPAIQAADALRRGSSKSFRVWRALAPEQRLSLIDASLRTAANQPGDGFPAAL